MAVEETLAEFKETRARSRSSYRDPRCSRSGSRTRRSRPSSGSMVAYQGDVKFEHAGSGGLKRMAKKAVTGEGAELMKISGTARSSSPTWPRRSSW